MILSRNHIQRVIREYFSGKPVKRVWLFGSYAGNEAKEDSDIDVLVDLEERSKIGLRYLAWHEDIERLVNKRVQVVSTNAISEYMRPFIEADKWLLYEK
ncbi:nucleotidyltransferase family protein [Sediminibacterium soli]|uniref:nucleotidyltransferase family protein n=1 Tax=Sediminibacterium soli TaxID=2698829 RepID=UPI00137B451F|nr:nucleotidyltransferase domain-containing protein [Sediminibacterium soli]NCI47456.1 nucleotidyltransferase [Sediminibacterium soli]